MRILPSSRAGQPPRRAARHGLRRGAAMVIVAFAIVPLTGMLALAVDIGMVYRARRNAQAAADAAAITYANERFRGNADNPSQTTALTQADTNGYRDGAGRVTVTQALGSWSNGALSTSNAITVTVKDTVNTLFARVFRIQKLAVVATATATYDIDPSTNCLFVLDASSSGAMNIDNNGDITSGCGLAINSSSSSAVTTNQHGDITAPSLAIVGGKTGNGAFTGTLGTGVAAAPSPAVGLVDPTPAATCSTVSTSNSSTTTLNPGTYCSISLGNNSTIYLNTGLYILKGGDITFAPNASLISNTGGVTIAFGPNAGGTYGTLNARNNSVINLTAQSSGAYAGVVLYKSALAPDVGINMLNGSGTTINGSFYAPSQTLNIKNNGSVTVTGALAVKKLQVDQNAHLVLPAATSSNTAYYAFKRPVLVE